MEMGLIIRLVGMIMIRLVFILPKAKLLLLIIKKGELIVAHLFNYFLECNVY